MKITAVVISFMVTAAVTPATKESLMRVPRAVFLPVLIAVAWFAFAQSSSAPSSAPSGAKPQSDTQHTAQAPSTAAPAEPATFASMIERQVAGSEKQIVEAAEAMPEDKFNFTPESLNIPGSNYKGVRTFALEVRHIATANYVFWSPLTGDKLPAGIKGPNGPEELKTKAEIVKFLKDSYALGHKAAASLTPANVLDTVPYAMGKSPRLHLAGFPVAHARDNYGQMVEYLRMNGIVPPASRGN